MFNKNILLIVFVCLFTRISAQTNNYEWQIGVGASIVQFSDENAAFIGDKNLLQIPRINVTKPLTDNLALDAALTFQTLDFGVVTNNVNYFSADASLRYFYEIGNFYPYVFAGASIVDGSYKITPTFNVGAGATFWVNNILGFNTQVYYKHSLNSFESMRSHIQVTGGMVFAINIFDLLFNGTISNGFCR